MTYFFIPFFLFLFSSCSSLTTHQVERKPSSYSDRELQKLWRPYDSKEKKLVTSNSFHYWAWSSNEAKKYLRQYIRFEGVVLGDPHPKNIFDYHDTQKGTLAVADIDDGGDAPFILDIARYLVYLKAAHIELSASDILNAYIEGTIGKEIKEPKFLQKILRDPIQKVVQEQKKWILKNTQGKKFNNKKLDLVPSKRLKKEQALELEKLGTLLTQPELKILDTGYQESNSGSSAGLSRYWFLLGDNRAENIIEFKQLETAAVAYYQKQENTKKRVQKIIAAYSEGFLNLGLVSTEENHYWMRPKHFQLLEVDELNKDEYKEWCIYLANWMGQKVYKQSEGKQLGQLLRSNKNDAIVEIEHFADVYIEEINRLNEESK
ncbi:MAG: hypothetical protein M9962_08590 [Oligoflexia bacterium]|nr:hypothetical protein [Oligoflexia bacterium]